MGFSDSTLSFFKSYLSKRPQQVMIGKVLSDTNYNERGVPQGSIIGPLLFILYINDIMTLKLTGQLQLYADDMAIIYSSESEQGLYDAIQNDLDILQDWFNTNLLKVNTSKSSYMIFYNRKLVNNNVEIKYDGKALERVETFCYLGLEIDHKLTWCKHIEKIRKSILPYIFAIGRLKSEVPRKTLLAIYNSFILPYLTYVSPIWSGTSKSNANILFILQKKALKYIYGLPFDHPTRLLFDTLMPVQVLWDRDLLMITYKILNGSIKNNLIIIKSADQHGYALRDSSLYKIKFFKTNARENNPFARGLMMYNGLPLNLKKVTNISRFRREVTDYLMDQFKLNLDSNSNSNSNLKN